MEIERKFLIDHELWNAAVKPEPKFIVQAYLVSTKEKTIRVRLKNNKGFLTIKGPTVGISRSEFEYEIPYDEAQDLIKEFSEKTIEKMRYEIPIGNHIWEVDVFDGKLKGLVIAEIELKSENESFEKPNWVTEDVSLDPQYFNSKLIEKC